MPSSWFPKVILGDPKIIGGGPKLLGGGPKNQEGGIKTGGGTSYQLGWTLWGRPKSSILRVPGESRSIIP